MSSIKDVAREAGVSTATVSHVLNNTRFVSEEMRARVLEAVELCGYYPNAHARSLASGRSQILGLVVSDISNPFFPELVKSIEAAAFERGYDVILSNTNYDPERTSHYVRRLIERKVVGVALMTSELDASLIGELARREVSVVFLDLGRPGVHMSNLCVNYEAGIEEAIGHLVTLGHSRIAFVGGPAHLRSAARRHEAFRKSMRRRLPKVPVRIHHGDFKLEGGRRAAREILDGRERPTAIVAANDMMALGVMFELRAVGLSIPHDISVIGFDDIAFAALSDPPLTTICLPRAELGRRAVEALMATLSHPDQQGVEIDIPTHLVIRGSTGPARGLQARSDARAHEKTRPKRKKS
ncbi:MAG: LacI family transcriptional regulator, repressor for deo operon, udp, cdd, tsx, nupC, and nupG [Acidobacteriota bacterium]|jgi:LacI family transcriptional regulator|nr:LacI family transcriptional regulator, repressor for deo operon, udp, cdd, tsx, nupC, and nupG [Acidobacteriota bacterium]